MPKLIVTLIVVCTMPFAAADTVYLTNGNQLTGEATRLAEPQSGYRVQLASGLSIDLAADQVSRVVDASPAMELYANRAQSVPDTVESQMTMAKWCREQGLADEYRVHLARVVELDPNHEEARSLLAFRRVDGKWLTREQQMAERGMIYHDGKFRTRQDVALLTRTASSQDQLADWRATLKRWRRWLDDRDPQRVREAANEFKQLTDPMAAEPLIELFKNEPAVAVRGLLLEAAAQIDHQATVNLLVLASVEDANEEIRYLALDYIVKSGRQGLVAPYAKLLASADNAFVNRAGVALGSIGDKSAIAPLIDALVTEHKTVVGGSGGGGDTYSFSPTSGGFSFGGSAPKSQPFARRNPDVLSALVRLSGGETFGYDAEKWRQWLATQAVSQQVNLRRTR